jgi:hypothetical protein
MSEIAFYPQMGFDIVTAINASPKICKIYSFGPLPDAIYDDEDDKKKSTPRRMGVDETMRMIKNLAQTGHNGVYIDSKKEEIEDFFELPVECSKEYHFKTKQMFMMQFKIGFEDEQRRIVTLYYYYNARMRDEEWPTLEPIDILIYKDYELPDKTVLIKKKLIKPTTKVVSTEYKLLSEWEGTEEDITGQEFIDSYDVIKDRPLKLYKIPFRIVDPDAAQEIAAEIKVEKTKEEIANSFLENKPLIPKKKKHIHGKKQNKKNKK